MTVNHHQIEPGVVVPIEEGGAPAHKRQAAGGRAGAEGDVDEITTFVAVKGVVFLGEIGDVEAFAAAAVVIAHGDPHTALLGAVFGNRDPAREGRFFEGAVFAVQVEKIGVRVVGHKKIRPAVGVGVEEGDAETKKALTVGHAGGHRNVGETVTIVAEQQVARARQAARATLHGDAAVLATFAFAELGQAVEVEFDVAADKKVEVAIAVVVAESATRRPAADGDAEFGGQVFEGAVAPIAVKPVGAEIGDVEIASAVAVDIGRTNAHTPAGISDAGLVADVFEGAVAAVAVKGAFGGGDVAAGFHGERVDEIEVGETVLVVIEGGHAAAHRLDDVLLFRRRGMPEGDAGGRGDVAEKLLGGGGRGGRQQS